MKKHSKIIGIALAVMAGILLCACGGKSEPKEPCEYAGYWKYEKLPFYLVISDDYTWQLANMYKQFCAPGTLEVTDENVVFKNDDGTDFATFTLPENGIMTDGEGWAVEYSDKQIYLPSKDDELDQTATYPGEIFSDININYPDELLVSTNPNIDGTLFFNPTVGQGTDDFYSIITSTFRPISGYDPYMTQGAGTAKIYMAKMADGLTSKMYDGFLIKSLGSDFKDEGDFYSMTVYMWIDGSYFAYPPEQPLRGWVNIRYYGPVGYALITSAITYEGRIQEYADITSKMLDTLNLNTGWNTAPKAVPQQAPPVEKAVGGTKQVKASSSGKKNSSSNKSDPEEYVIAYYWYDDDGDVWYWNGYENEFIGFGSSCYIGDDGEYYCGDDYGDLAFNAYYDYADDFDPWSDPGDYYDDSYNSYDVTELIEAYSTDDYEEPEIEYDYSDLGDSWDSEESYDDYDSYDSFDDYGGYDDFGDDW